MTEVHDPAQDVQAGAIAPASDAIDDHPTPTLPAEPTPPATLDVGAPLGMGLPGLLQHMRNLEDATMVDDQTKTGKPDRDRINVNEVYEVRHWANVFGVTMAELQIAVRRAGPMAKDVAKALGKEL